MERWENWHDAPDHLSYEVVKAELDLVEKSLVPATREEMAVGLAKLMEFARAFGITQASGDQVRSMTEFYRQALSDMPGDLVVEACMRAAREWRWGNRMPLPADLKALVADDFNARRVAQIRIHTASRKILRRDEMNAPRAEPDPELAARAKEILERMGRKINQPQDEQ